MPEKPNVIAGSSGPLVPLTEDELDAYLRLDTWTLTEALFILSGNRPPGFESSSELMSHFWDAYHLAVNSIQSGNLCRKITVAGQRHFIESPSRWFSWAERKSLHVAEAVRTEMMSGESATNLSLNEDRPSPAPVSKTDRQPDGKQPSYAGRPSQIRAIIREMHRRSEEGVLCPILADEARALCQWAEAKFPDDQTPKELSMQNAIRSEYNKLQRTPI